MDTIQLLGSTLGLGFVAGVRLYATVLALGLAIRFDWFHLAASQEHLRVLSHPAVLITAGIAFLLEFVSDKIPWVDSVWDSIHTFIRPIGAALLAAAALGHIDPALKFILILLCGGVALSSHSSKAATRLIANHSPEPLTNIALSVAEDLFAPAGIWLSFTHPVLTLTLVLIFLIGFLWVSPKVFRAIRLQVVALGAWLAGARPRPPGASLHPEIPDALQPIVRNASPWPAAFSRAAQNGPLEGVRCAATRNIRGLRNCIGYLGIAKGELVFVARRLFRYRVHRIRISEIQSAEWKRGLLMNRLILRTLAGECAFYVFKDVNPFRTGGDAVAAGDAAVVQ